MMIRVLEASRDPISDDPERNYDANAMMKKRNVSITENPLNSMCSVLKFMGLIPLKESSSARSTCAQLTWRNWLTLFLLFVPNVTSLLNLIYHLMSESEEKFKIWLICFEVFVHLVFIFSGCVFILNWKSMRALQSELDEEFRILDEKVKHSIRRRVNVVITLLYTLVFFRIFICAVTVGGLFSVNDFGFMRGWYFDLGREDTDLKPIAIAIAVSITVISHISHVSCTAMMSYYLSVIAILIVISENFNSSLTGLAESLESDPKEMRKRWKVIFNQRQNLASYVGETEKSFSCLILCWILNAVKIVIVFLSFSASQSYLPLQTCLFMMYFSVFSLIFLMMFLVPTAKLYDGNAESIHIMQKILHKVGAGNNHPHYRQATILLSILQSDPLQITGYKLFVINKSFISSLLIGAVSYGVIMYQLSVSPNHQH